MSIKSIALQADNFNKVKDSNINITQVLLLVIISFNNITIVTTIYFIRQNTNTLISTTSLSVFLSQILLRMMYQQSDNGNLNELIAEYESKRITRSMKFTENQYMDTQLEEKLVENTRQLKGKALNARDSPYCLLRLF